MGARLDQVLAYLDREGVTEIVLGVGRPLMLKRADKMVPMTSAPLTRGQLGAIVDGTPLAALLPARDGVSEPVELSIGARRVRVEVGRRAEEIVMKILRAAPAAPQAAAEPPPEPSAVSFKTTPRPATPAPHREAAAPRTPSAMPRPREIDLASAGPAVPRRSTGSIDVDFDTHRPGAPIELPPRPASTPPPSAASPGAGTIDLGFGIDLGLPTTPAPAPAPARVPIDLRAREPVVAPISSIALPVASAALPPAIQPSPITAAALPHLSEPAETGWFPRELADIVRRAYERGATDLHIASGRATAVRVLGELVPLDPAAGVASARDVDALLLPLLVPYRARFDEVGYVDFAAESPIGGRLRTNLSRSQGGLKAAFRIARATPPTLDDLGLPVELAKVIAHHQGLVVIAGPSGHGKSTTLAALVDRINAARPYHIITVEDPVEIVYPRKAAVVSQREVGAHTLSFAAALKGSLREDPDVIVIGELRDRETVEIALTAAETGHLVLATMSAPSAAKTIDRLVDMFPPDDQSQVRASIAGALRAIVSQRLLPSATGAGMVAAVELLTGCLPLAAMIRDDKVYQLPNLMQRGRAFGMIRLDDSLLELVRAGRISPETALATTDNRRELGVALGGAPRGTPDPRGGGLGKRGRE